MLTQGQKITLVRIDDMMALTHRYELEVRQVLPEPHQRVGYYQHPRVAIVRPKGKRKDQYYDLRPDDLVFDGWNVPFKADTEVGGIFSGNACFNLVGLPSDIKAFIETKAVFPITDSSKAKVIVWPAKRTACGDSEGALLYPEIDTHHAVIERMKHGTAV
jgi:hypothetical protein